MCRPSISDLRTKYTYRESIEHAVFPARREVNEKCVVLDEILGEIPRRSFIVRQRLIVLFCFSSSSGFLLAVISFYFIFFVSFSFLDWRSGVNCVENFVVSFSFAAAAAAAVVVLSGCFFFVCFHGLVWE